MKQLILPDTDALVGMPVPSQRHYNMLRLRDERDEARQRIAWLVLAIEQHKRSTPGNRQRAADKRLYEDLEEALRIDV